MIPCALKEVSQNTEEWQVQTIVDSLTGSAESINEIFQKINAHTNKKRSTSFINIYPRNYKSVRLKIKETDSFHTRFILGSKIKGYMRILTGMTFINNPLNMLQTLSGVLAIGFTTGAFCMAFTTM